MNNPLFSNMAEYEAFFKTHYQELCQYAYKFIRDRNEAEDIVQIFFVKLWENKDLLSVSSINSYSFRAIRNSCLNQIIKNERHQQTSIDTLVDTMVDYVTDDEDTIYSYRDKTRKAIQKIPSKSRKILLLHCITGLKYQEIAQHLGISINTVKSQINVAYKILREELQDLFPTILFLLWMNNIIN